MLLASSEAAGHGCYVGQGSGGPIFAAPEHGVLVLGPPRSGKTSGIVIPAVLHACGPVVATSTKPDVMRVTAPARARQGDCLLFDPSGTVEIPRGVQAVGWSPLSAARTWRGALLVADSMVQAARPKTEGTEAAHWTERAQALLAAAFHAGALDEMPLRRVVSLIERREGAALRLPLARESADRALDLLNGLIATDSREQSGIWSTASGVIAGYRSEPALASAELRPPGGDFVEGPHTIYVCASSDHQRAVAPLVVGLLRDLRSSAYARSAAAFGYRTEQPEALAARAPAGAGLPMLFALDELAHIAPLHDLPSLVAEGGSQGVVTLACLQDLSQGDRWGREADGFLTMFGSKILLPGIGDTRTLESLSRLCGDVDVHVRSVSSISSVAAALTGAAQSSHTDSPRKEARLPVDALARGIPGRAVLMEGARPYVVDLVPWYESREMNAAVERGRTAMWQRAGPDTGVGRHPAGRARSPRSR